MPKWLRHIVWYLFVAVALIPVAIVTAATWIGETWLQPLVSDVRVWSHQELYYRPGKNNEQFRK